MLRAGIEGFSRDTLGFLVASYYVGMMLGTLRCGPLVNRIGHIRAFAAFSAIIASTALAFPFVTHPLAWCLLRALMGFNIAGVLMVSESWLNHKATPNTRGRLLSMYMMTCYLSLGGGQFLVNVGEAEGGEVFAIAAILFAMAVVPVAVTRATHPPPVESSHFNLRVLIAISPVATVACVCSGLSLSALWGLGPVFASGLGMSVAQVSAFMTAIIFSALLFQFPVGRLSDRFDRRKVMLGVSAAAAVASIAMVVQLSLYATDEPAAGAWSSHPLAIGAVACLYGGTISTLYSLGVAYANDRTDSAHMLSVGAGLVLAFGAGAALGAVPAAMLMEYLGPRGLFVYAAVIAVGLTGFITLQSRPPRPGAGLGKRCVRRAAGSEFNAPAARSRSEDTAPAPGRIVRPL